MRRMTRTVTLLSSSVMALALSAATFSDAAAQIIGTVNR